MDEGAHTEMASEVLKVIVDSNISSIFAQNSKAEVPIAGLLMRDGYPPRKVSGQIDRLAVLENEVLIADFKTNSASPKGPEGVPKRTIAQLATYRALIADLYPDRKIRCFVIYTAALQVFELADEVLSASLTFIE